jgi:hypothetical protein
MTASLEARRMSEEDTEIRAHLAELGPGALIDLRRVLEGSADHRREILVALMTRPTYADLEDEVRWGLRSRPLEHLLSALEVLLG